MGPKSPHLLQMQSFLEHERIHHEAGYSMELIRRVPIPFGLGMAGVHLSSVSFSFGQISLCPDSAAFNLLFPLGINLLSLFNF